MAKETYPPLVFQWTDDGVMKPHRPYAKLADRLFVVGESYRLEPREERSAKTHRHYFASVTEAWENLPERYARRFPEAEALRAEALCHTGWCDHNSWVFDTPEESKQFALMVRKYLKYAVISVNDCVVVVRVAKSQSQRAMNKEDFQRSKTDVLNWISNLIGVNRSDLERQNPK